MPVAESPSTGGDSSRDQLLPEQLGCCRDPNCVHQLHQLVYCYYGFRPFLDNAQVQLSEATARASPPAEESQSRAGQARRRPGRGQSTVEGRSGGRGPRGRAERSATSRSSTPTSGQSATTSAWQTQGRTPTTPTQTAQTGSQSRTPTVQKQAKTTARPPAAATPARGATPNPAATAAPSTAHTPTQLATPASATEFVLNSSRSRMASQTRRPTAISASAPVLHATPPPPLPPAAPERGGHLAAILDRLSLLATPPGSLPAFVRVPPPQTNVVFCGSRSHGSLEVELGRCRYPGPARRRRHRSAALPEAEEVTGGATCDAPLPCCPGGRGHRDSYDPRLDVQPAGEERSREQVRAEWLLKNFNMFRDWDYVPFIVEPAVRSGAIRRRAYSVDSISDSDSDLEPTVTICRRVGGVFHYIPAQRLLKNATKNATAAGDGTDRRD